VLIDEIAADTDPREGAALATAVLEELLDRGALVLVTTHLEELKALAHLDTRFVNARVGFDARRMAPTFRLQLGYAGASSAIGIARRVGLPDAICVRATALASGSGGALSRALQAADEERRLASEQRAEAQTQAEAARRNAQALEQELEAAARARKEAELGFRASLRAELEYARAQVKALVEKLSQDTSDRALKAAQAASAELASRATEQTTAERGLRRELEGQVRELQPLELKVGARARHRGLEAEVEILEVSQGTATVALGALRMRVQVEELAPTERPKGPSRPPGASRRKEEALENAARASAQPITLASPTLDLRGQRAEDALRQLEQFLDRLTRSGDEAAIVIHGHGTGALKRELREYLAHSPYARSFRPGDATEGGDGATVVVLA
jgi:DNA mismatch repair protein MutS2